MPIIKFAHNLKYKINKNRCDPRPNYKIYKKYQILGYGYPRFKNTKSIKIAMNASNKISPQKFRFSLHCVILGN